MKTIWKQYPCFGNIAERGINEHLRDNPGVKVVSIVPIILGYVGNETSPGILVEFHGVQDWPED